jgi:hypothetical protein
MADFNPYLIDEIVTEANANRRFFGLIDNTDAERTELYGYEVTMSGKLVMPVLHPQPPQIEDENQAVSMVIA